MSGGGGGLDVGKELAQLDKDLSLSQNAPLIAAATAMYLSGGTIGGETLAGTGAAGAAGTAAGTAGAAEIAGLSALDAGAGVYGTGAGTAFSAAPAAVAAPAAIAAPPAASAVPMGAGADVVGSGMSAPYVGPQAAMAAGAPAAPAAPGLPGLFDQAAAAYGKLPTEAQYGIPLAAAAMYADRKAPPPTPTPYDGPLNKLRYDPDRYQPLEVKPPVPYTPVYKDYRGMAEGGLADLGSYSDGGRMLKGPGDGMSDSIPATIAGKQPARLANDEFVVPADVVSHLGNGSSDAGAKQLYKMMDKVRSARTGKKSQAKQINPDKYLPA